MTPPPPARPGLASLKMLVVVALLWNGCTGCYGWLWDALRTAENLCAGVEIGAPLGDFEARAQAVGFHYYGAPRRKGNGRSDVTAHFAMNKMAPNRPTCWVEVERGLVISKHTSSD